jgi:hypothetical protein
MYLWKCWCLYNLRIESNDNTNFGEPIVQIPTEEWKQSLINS